MKRYIKCSENFTGMHPLDVLFPSMADWFEEDVCEQLGSILDIDGDELRILIAKNAGIEVDDPWDYDVVVSDVYDYINKHKNYYNQLNQFIDEHKDDVEREFDL